MQKHRLW